ncbi:hypothetical protein [Klebsiella phage PhiKpNIH-6]|uniref:Uncharacterized protein n=2 Tax=Marfavirus F48 TaxID=2845079 RepID=A0A6B9LXD8_9CAUD|nr:hypothetical protein [Klebsiella phage vB_Kpn_P545]QHB49481.1 hypothetical protein [Klebsiella phage PhiKpNIH-6]
MSKYTFEVEVPEYNDYKSAREAIKAVMGLTEQIEAEAEAIADEMGVSFSTGDYGNGRTYHPKGTNAEDNGLEFYCREYEVDLDENGNMTEGAWVSSSEMC